MYDKFVWISVILKPYTTEPKLETLYFTSKYNTIIYYVYRDEAQTITIALEFRVTDRNNNGMDRRHCVGSPSLYLLRILWYRKQSEIRISCRCIQDTQTYYILYYTLYIILYYYHKSQWWDWTRPVSLCWHGLRLEI